MSLDEVAVHLSSNNTIAIEKQLHILLESPSNLILENADVIKLLLQCRNIKILQLTAQIVAELAKNPKYRNILTDTEVLQLLLKQVQAESSDIVYQTFRAIGNICFENGNACSLIGDEGLEQILNTVQFYQNRKEHVDVFLAGWGVLLNLVSTSEALTKAAFKLDILNIIESVLSRSEGDGDAVIQQLLIILNAVADEIQETQQQQLKKLCYEVIRIMKTTTNLEIGALCLEFLFSQSESRKCE